MARVSERAILTEDQVQCLIDAADRRIRPAIMAMAWMGLRPSEVGLVDWVCVRHQRGQRSILVPCFKSKTREHRVIPTELWAEIGNLSPEARRQVFAVSRSVLIGLYQKSALATMAAARGHMSVHDLRRYWLHRQRRAPR